MIRDRITTWQHRVAAEQWVLVPLRLLVGFGFAAHGYAKLARGVEFFAAALAGMGIPAPTPMAWATALLELAGGVAILLGAYVVPLALPLGVVMATAIVGVHLPYGFSSIKLKAITAAGAEFGPPGFEVPLFYLAALLALVANGPTAWSIDRWRAARARRPSRSG